MEWDLFLKAQVFILRIIKVMFLPVELAAAGLNDARSRPVRMMGHVSNETGRKD